MNLKREDLEMYEECGIKKQQINIRVHLVQVVLYDRSMDILLAYQSGQAFTEARA